MDTYSNRTSTLFTTFTTVLFTVAALNHLTSYFYSSSPVASIAVTTGSTIDFTEYKPYKADQVKFDFDLSIDLTSVNNWNVNQLYVFVVASYETSKNDKNEIVVYDRILRDVSEFKFTLKNVKNKYVLRDEFKGTLAGKKIKLSVRYQVMPVFGILWVKEVPVQGEFTIPDAYTSTATNGKTKKR